MSSGIGTPITLESVKAQFDQWRATRTTDKRIPYVLWEAVIHLTKHHELKKIACALKLNTYRIREKMNNHDQQTPVLSSTPDFIEIPIPLTSIPSHPPSCDPYSLGTIELIRPNGVILKASGLNTKDLSSFIHAFIN